MTHYSARRLPLQRGVAAWNALLPARQGTEALTGSITADVVVVGAGFAGLSAARRLKQLDPALRVVVLEAGRVAEGAAGRNSGFMIDLPHELTSEDYSGGGDDRAVIDLNRQAIGFAGEAVEAYGMAAGVFDRAGKINGAVSAAAVAHNRSYAEHLASLGETSTLLDAQQMAEVTGSRHYASGLYTPGTVMLQPAAYVRGLAEGLMRDGVVLHENSPVTGFEKQGAGWRVATQQGQVSAGKVILTVNGHLESFGFEKGRLMQLFLYAVITPELGPEALKRLGGQPRWGITPSDPMGTTVRRIDSGQGGNRIVTRTCATLRPGMRVSQGDLDRAARIMQRKFDQRFPALAGMKMENAWAGHLCLSMNSVAVARQLDEGVFSGCVQNGLGTARGTLTGICAAELAMGTETAITRHFTAEARPSKLPPQPFKEMGANAVLRWREWKARDE
ncbi:FAD-binding oxidoreductase [Cereibacter sphaeroides]|nr:FAD-binding oxidoreductase [Cereibacter sphaeroides]